MLSIIIPIYNSAQYLHRCIDSVLRQTYKDIELVLIDDGSSDSSAEICDDYARKDMRVRVLHQANQGASIARKRGIDVAVGEWLTFVDSDDAVEEDYIERLYDAAIRYDIKIAACNQIQHKEGTEIEADKTGKTVLLKEQELHKRFFKYQFWGFWGKIYHRSVFENTYFPKYTINEDYVVMVQLFNRCKQMAYVPMDLYHYMVHEDSLSHQKLSLRMFDEYHNKRWVVGYYKNNNRQYVHYAEAQLVETCIKLIGLVGENGTFEAEKKQMQEYLRKHIVGIMKNPHLLFALKCMALKRCL
ncbi:MAG: glycosyltransferase family 2 protein [Prevotellaceae bacterium]|nr:glycosyltransferase family 2 protein [Prevotellaceae bacterium]